MIRLDVKPARGAQLEVERSALPPTGDDEYYIFQLVGLNVVEETGRAARNGRHGDAGRRQRRARARRRPRAADGRGVHPRGRSRGRTYPCRRRFLGLPGLNPLQLDVFTLVPHAFGWLTEQRPVATVVGSELDLRLFSYRDMTPLRNGQIDDEPYGGGAGMVLRVDVVAAALDAVYGGQPTHRVIALTPAGAPAHAERRRGACARGAADAALGPLRGLRRADRGAPLHGLALDRPVRPVERRSARDGA